MSNSFNSRTKLSVQGKHYTIYKLAALEQQFQVSRLPYSLKILLENLLRLEDGVTVTRDDIEALAQWEPKAKPAREIAFSPARVLLQDFTGVPAVVDLAAMRDAMQALGGDATKINPLSPVELVIDHSVQIDFWGRGDALAKNNEMDFQRNRQRYSFLKWGQQSFENFKVVPPDTGICHQVNLEYLSRVVFESEVDGELQAYPDTLVGTDSHTTMVNGLGVLGWGVGGIEAEAAMLGQPSTMLIPQVLGVRLSGELPAGATATDLVLTVTERLRETGVVGMFVEYFGPGVAKLPLASRATLGNMSPEFGSTCAIFPIDQETLNYLRLSGRSEAHIKLVESYAKIQGLWHEAGQTPAAYSQVIELDLATIEPSIAGPKRPQDRISLTSAKTTILKQLAEMAAAQTKKIEVLERFENEGGLIADATPKPAHASDGGVGGEKLQRTARQLRHGDLVIAAITSCTNTSNPEVMLGAGLLARKARALGVKPKAWVKTSLAPGSKVVTDYLIKTGLQDDLDALGFNLVGYGCTTCIGNSGPLLPAVSERIKEADLIVSAVLSGNRNFEGRIQPQVKMNFLASPPLVVAYAIAGSMTVDLANEPLAEAADGSPVYLKDIWPSQQQISDLISANINADMFKRVYERILDGDDNWNSLQVPAGESYQWQDASTYVRNPPYFEGMRLELDAVEDIHGARVLALLGDSVTTDHISPAGSIAVDSPAGQYLLAQGVAQQDFNSYGARRGNHEVMVRGTFANIRLRNQLVPGTEGGFTCYLPDNEVISIYDAAMKYQQSNTPLLVIAGKEYGSGSSRDWAAKGALLLGVKAVIAKSFERIHRANLIGMGVLPLEFQPGQDADTLGLTGREQYSVTGLAQEGVKEVAVEARDDSGQLTNFTLRVRLDTPKERSYYRNGGILQYVLRQLMA